MTFQQVNDEITGQVSQVRILYTDDNGVVWTVPSDHRFWTLYQDWIAAGNNPLPPQ